MKTLFLLLAGLFIVQTELIRIFVWEISTDELSPYLLVIGITLIITGLFRCFRS